MHTDVSLHERLYDIPVRTIGGRDTTLAPWRG